MWQRFTERARRVILLGQEEAGRMNSGYVGTEHLLLGLVRINEGVAAQVLVTMGVSLAKVRAEIEGEVQPANDPTLGEPKLTPKAKRVLELAADEARRMRHNYIGTEHLLLALLREQEGLAATVLHRLGFNLEKARSQVMEYLNADAPEFADSFSLDEAATSGGKTGQFEVSPAVQKLLALAAQESRAAGATSIEVRHLLRALCHPGSEGAQHLEAVGVDTERLRLIYQSPEQK